MMRCTPCRCISSTKLLFSAAAASALNHFYRTYCSSHPPLSDRIHIFSTMGSAPSGLPARRMPSNTRNDCDPVDASKMDTGSLTTSCTVSPTVKKSAHSERFPSFELDDSSVVSVASIPGPRFFQYSSPSPLAPLARNSTPCAGRLAPIPMPLAQ